MTAISRTALTLGALPLVVAVGAGAAHAAPAQPGLAAPSPGQGITAQPAPPQAAAPVQASPADFIPDPERVLPSPSRSHPTWQPQTVLPSYQVPQGDDSDDAATEPAVEPVAGQPEVVSDPHHFRFGTADLYVPDGLVDARAKDKAQKYVDFGEAWIADAYDRVGMPKDQADRAAASTMVGAVVGATGGALAAAPGPAIGGCLGGMVIGGIAGAAIAGIPTAGAAAPLGAAIGAAGGCAVGGAVLGVGAAGIGAVVGGIAGGGLAGSIGAGVDVKDPGPLPALVDLPPAPDPAAAAPIPMAVPAIPQPVIAQVQQVAAPLIDQAGVALAPIADQVAPIAAQAGAVIDQAATDPIVGQAITSLKDAAADLPPLPGPLAALLGTPPSQPDQLAN